MRVNKDLAVLIVKLHAAGFENFGLWENDDNETRLQAKDDIGLIYDSELGIVSWGADIDEDDSEYVGPDDLVMFVRAFRAGHKMGSAYRMVDDAKNT